MTSGEFSGHNDGTDQHIERRVDGRQPIAIERTAKSDGLIFGAPPEIRSVMRRNNGVGVDIDRETATQALDRLDENVSTLVPGQRADERESRSTGDRSGQARNLGKAIIRNVDAAAIEAEPHVLVSQRR